MIPARLIVGPENHMYDHVMAYLQQVFCPHHDKKNPGCFCGQCRQLKNHQHPSVVWIEPEKDYVVDNIAVIFEKVKFTLEDGQQFFFVLNKAETLNPSCANRLLKILEEPPPGYQFMLCATNEHAVLPTIRSRCHLQHLVHTGTHAAARPLLAYFREHKKLSDPIGFDQELRTDRLSEKQSVALLNELIAHYQHQYRKAFNKYETIDDVHARESEHAHIKRVLDFLYNALRMPPAPGGAKIFWRYLFLSFPR